MGLLDCGKGAGAVSETTTMLRDGISSIINRDRKTFGRTYVLGKSVSSSSKRFEIRCLFQITFHNLYFVSFLVALFSP